MRNSFMEQSILEMNTEIFYFNFDELFPFGQMKGKEESSSGSQGTIVVDIYKKGKIHVKCF